MRSMMRMRFRCDHCKRSSGTRKSMEKHERGCTANPARECGMCGLMGSVQLTSAEAAQVLADKGFDEMRRAMDDCPACILAAVRAAWKADVDFSVGDWDFRAACAEFWADRNKAMEDDHAALW